MGNWVWLVVFRPLVARLPAVVAWLAIASGAALAQADDGADVRRVLILYSSDQTLPATNIVGAEVLRELGASRTPKIEVRSDFLDMSRFKYPSYRDDLADFSAKQLRDQFQRADVPSA